MKSLLPSFKLKAVFGAAFCLLMCCAACRPQNDIPVKLNTVTTLAGASNNKVERALFGEPFGVAVGRDDTVYVSDGERGRIIAIAKDGATRTLIENLATPSAIALTADADALIVAETGAHVIRRIEIKDAAVTAANTVIAGTFQQPGFIDGIKEAARFNAPVGVAVDKDNVIYVADTYNDAIRRIDKTGNVTTILKPSVNLSASETSPKSASLNTPCGIAVLTNGELIVADTGNNLVRFINAQGAMRSLQGANQDFEFSEPIGIAVDKTGSIIYVAEAGASQIKIIRVEASNNNEQKNQSQAKSFPSSSSIADSQTNLKIETLSGDKARYGFADGNIAQASFARPYGIALTKREEVIVADSDNKLVRVIGEAGSALQRGQSLTKDAAKALQTTVAEFRQQAAGRWCYEPPDKRRELAATFGEVRAAVTETQDGRFHNGIDIPGAYGETVFAMRAETVLRPLAVEDTETARERLRLPQLGYIHLRIGRDKDNQAFDLNKFQIVLDDKGKPQAVRVRRGTRIHAGERIGTLNNQNHTHLIAGSYGSEMNGLAALDLPGITDTLAPVFESNAIKLFKPDGSEFTLTNKSNAVNSSATNANVKTAKTIDVNGEVRITARVYDRMDGGAERRRLGVYRLGYQVLDGNQNPVEAFKQVRWTLTFDRLPSAARANGFGASTVYAKGSQAGYSPNTVFAYIITNTLQDGETTEDFWHTDELAEGNYIVRIFAEDYFGNRSTQDLAVRIVR